MIARRREQTGVERGSARRFSLKGRERAILNQTNIGTVSKFETPSARIKLRTSHYQSPGGERRRAWKEEALDDFP